MKTLKLLGVVVALIATSTANAQTSITAIDDNLYIGYNNQIRVVTNEIKPGKEIIKISGKDSAFVQISGDSGVYTITTLVTIPIDSKIKISVYRPGEKSVSLKKLTEKIFTVKILPTPVVSFTGHEAATEMTAEQLMASPLQVTLPSTGFRPNWFEIIDFDLVLYVKGNMVTFRNSGAQLDDKTRILLEQVTKGDIVTIKNLNAKSVNGTTRLAPVSVKIK
ncbi:MAG: GldM family protein [Flavobacteriales bacterium]